MLKIIIENNKILEAKAWTRKYFKDDSEENRFFFINIRGIKESKLISNPIHKLNQELDDTQIKVPKIIVEKKTIL